MFFCNNVNAFQFLIHSTPLPLSVSFSPQSQQVTPTTTSQVSTVKPAQYEVQELSFINFMSIICVTEGLIFHKMFYFHYSPMLSLLGGGSRLLFLLFWVFCCLMFCKRDSRVWSWWMGNSNEYFIHSDQVFNAVFNKYIYVESYFLVLLQGHSCDHVHNVYLVMVIRVRIEKL